MTLQTLNLILLVLGVSAAVATILTFLAQVITLLARGLYELRMWVQRRPRLS